MHGFSLSIGYHCEFLFKCIETTVEKNLPEERVFLERRDKFHRRINEIVDMGERMLDLLLAFLRQSHGRLSKRARSREFALFTEDEIARVESISIDLFHGGVPADDA